MTESFWRFVARLAERVLLYAERQLPQDLDVLARLAVCQAAWLERGGPRRYKGQL
jgi:hypothetical protein